MGLNKHIILYVTSSYSINSLCENNAHMCSPVLVEIWVLYAQHYHACLTSHYIFGESPYPFSMWWEWGKNGPEVQTRDYILKCCLVLCFSHIFTNEIVCFHQKKRVCQNNCSSVGKVVQWRPIMHSTITFHSGIKYIKKICACFVILTQSGT